ncbi:hypothetical protein V8F20_002211 [Naviculisporaceae sp. PSN 640]
MRIPSFTLGALASCPPSGQLTSSFLTQCSMASRPLPSITKGPGAIAVIPRPPRSPPVRTLLASTPRSTRAYHPGPVTIYLSKAPGNVRDYNSFGDWFKVYWYQLGMRIPWNGTVPTKGG